MKTNQSNVCPNGLKQRSPIRGLALSVTLLGIFVSGLLADDFGSGGDAFIIDFVNVDNAGNANDVATGLGGVGYEYRISTYEITANVIDKSVNLGLSNVVRSAHTNGNQPVVYINWYEAAAFVNWMNTSEGYQAAYDLSYSGSWSISAWGASDQASTGVDSGTNAFRHKDAVYFIPSEDEWYKAAFHQNNGVTSDYFLYATGSDTLPDGVDFVGDTDYDAVFKESGNTPGAFDVTISGVSSPYGTFGQNGNVWEWNERANGGTITGDVRGAAYGESASEMVSSYSAADFGATSENHVVGFRVASVAVIPEPSSLALMAVVGLASLTILRRRKS